MTLDPAGTRAGLTSTVKDDFRVQSKSARVRSRVQPVASLPVVVEAVYTLTPKLGSVLAMPQGVNVNSFQRVARGTGT